MKTFSEEKKVAEIIKLHGSDGWYFFAQKWSHKQYKDPVKRGKVTVPVHGKNDELEHFLVDSILRQAGIKWKCEKDGKEGNCWGLFYRKELLCPCTIFTRMWIYSGVFTKAALSRVTGINERQLWHYAAGVRKPRRAQAKRIEEGIHRLGKELLTIQLE